MAPRDTAPIPIAWKVRIQQIAQTRLPAVLFAVSVAGLVYLWSYRTPEMVVLGHVQAARVSVPATTSGLLVPLDRPLQTFDRVQKGLTLVARFDVSAMLLEMQTLTAERDRLDALLRAEAERLRWQQRQWSADQNRQQMDRDQLALTRRRVRGDALRLATDQRQERQRLEEEIRGLLLRRSEHAAQQATLAIEAEHLASQVAQISELVDKEMTPSFRLTQLQQQLDLKRQQLTQSEQVAATIAGQLAELQREKSAADVRTEPSNDADQLFAADQTVSSVEGDAGGLIDVETSLAPLEQALVVQDARIRELAKRIADNEVRAPISGRVTAIAYPPGTFVRQGEPILTIAAEQPECIVVYLDAEQRTLLRENGPVKVRRRGRNPLIAEAKVLELGTQIELIPEQVRVNAALVQYGLPVKIALPAGLPLLPGELVDVLIRSPHGIDRS